MGQQWCLEMQGGATQCTHPTSTTYMVLVRDGDLTQAPVEEASGMEMLYENRNSTVTFPYMTAKVHVTF